MSDAPISLRNEIAQWIERLPDDYEPEGFDPNGVFYPLGTVIDAIRAYAARGSVEAREVATLIGLSCDGTCCGGT